MNSQTKGWIIGTVALVLATGLGIGIFFADLRSLQMLPPPPVITVTVGDKVYKATWIQYYHDSIEFITVDGKNIHTSQPYLVEAD